VHVLVAGCATKLIEVVRYYLCTGQRLVALVAFHRHVAARKRKCGLLVFGKREVCRLKCGPVVALLAPVSPRLAGKLTFMLVLMTVDASSELDFEFRCRAGGHVA